MKSTNARKGSSALLALVLALALPGSAFAATAGGSTTESLVVVSAITMTGVPATISYGSATAGAVVDAPQMTITVSSDAAAGWTLGVDASDLTSGGDVIPKTSRAFRVASGTGYIVLAGWDTYKQYTAPANVAGKDGPGSGAVKLDSRINIPPAAAHGTYAGTITFTAATK